MAIPIARQHPIGLDDQRLRLRHWGIVGRRFVSRLHVCDGRPLLAFQFSAGGLSVGAQGFGTHLHPGQCFEQLGCLGENGQPTDQRFPVLHTATGPLFWP